jgi:hypothetical protein
MNIYQEDIDEDLPGGFYFKHTNLQKVLAITLDL